MTEQQPELREQQPYKAVIESDWKTFATFGKKEILLLFFATHSGMTIEAFRAIAQPWLNSATHPRFQRLFLQCAYQPMLELLAYLRANGFKNLTFNEDHARQGSNRAAVNCSIVRNFFITLARTAGFRSMATAKRKWMNRFDRVFPLLQ